MLKLDTASFMAALRKLESVDVFTLNASPYLIEHVAYPFLRGEAVDLSGLDYSQFSSSDICKLQQAVENASTISGKALHLAGAIAKTQPVVRVTKQFC